MNIQSLKKTATAFFQKNQQTKKEALALYHKTIAALESGTLRVAEKVDEQWIINTWVKEVILLGFKHGSTVALSETGIKYYDKDTMPLRRLTLNNKVRMVPGGTAIRCGSYIACNTVIMPPAYINIGAYIDSGCMIDSHSLVGSCAQIGKNVHLSAAAQIGGVLEPIGAMPVIIEEDVFIGGNCGIYEGIIVKAKAVLGSGVILNGSTPIFDSVNNRFIKKTATQPLTVPKNAVVIAGTRPLTSTNGQKNGVQIYCPIIIKYRDDKTRAAVALEEALR